MDTDKFDREYGVGNWEIAAWHSKDLLQQIPSEYYVEKRHVPVIKRINDGKLFSQPMTGVMMRPPTPLSMILKKEPSQGQRIISGLT